jgi:hypothetical protein
MAIVKLLANKPLLPGPKKGCLQICGKFGQIGKNSAFFQTYILTAKNDKININMAYLDN